ncbi:uncharacterized protein [Eleutherodactylus coqui]|uniref:uncharacterized protein n=1 Tax=Eleutherodactylus coqui TaxID=57060 RepID=UPI0034618A6C
MDTSASVKSKGGTPNRPLTSRPSLSKNTKTGSPTPKVATESPRPATSRGPTSKPTTTKVATAVKEANAAKSSTVRTAAASPNKPKTVTARESASPVKPPAKQTTRPQNGEKGTQQTASLLVTKNEAAKKTAEGAQLNKPRPAPEGGNTTPSKRNGMVKREVGKPPENGSVPKDKTSCLRPESCVSVPTKPLATSTSPTKTLKANPASHKPKQIVPPSEKLVNTTSLSTKATKSPMASTRPGATNSTAAKPAKTASPLVKASKPTPVSTKVTKIPTSPVKPLSTSSASTKPRNVTPVKPPGNSMSTTNQVKVGKQLSTTTKATSVSAKQINNVPTAIKPVKSSHKTVMEERAEATPIVNEITPVANEISKELIIDLEAEKIEMNKTEILAELQKPLDPLIAEEKVVVVPMNVIDNTTIDDRKTAGELLKESELPQDTSKTIIPTEQCSTETHSQDKERQLPLNQEAKSLRKQVTPLEEEVSHSVREPPMSESSIVSAKPLYEEQKSKKPFKEQLNVSSEHLQEEQRSPLEIPLADPDKPLEIKEETAKELKDGAASSELAANNVNEGVHVPIKTSDDEVASTNELSKETVEENRSLEEGQIACMDRDTHLNQSERMPIKALDDETFTAECVEPLEDVATSSLEQVTPLEEEIVLSEDEPVQQKCIMLEKHRNPSKTLEQLEISPIDPHNPLELLTSSTEELTPSEEDLELLKDNKETLQERPSCAEPLAMGEVACKINLPKLAETATSSKEEIVNLEEPFGETRTNETSEEMPINEILQSSDEIVKHSEERNIEALYPLQSSVEEGRLSEEPPILSEDTQQSSFEVVKPPLESLVEINKSPQENQLVEPQQVLSEDMKSSEEEAIISLEPLQPLIEEVKLSKEEPLRSVGPLQYSAEADQSLKEQTISEESQQSVEVKSAPEEPGLSKEPLQSSVEADRSLEEEQTSSLLLLKSSLEPLTPLEANILSSFGTLTEMKEGIMSLEETKSEGSRSLVQLPEQSQSLVKENDNEVPQEHTEKEGNASLEKEDEIVLMGQQRPLVEQFHSIIEPERHDAEILGASIVELSEQVEQANITANMDPKGIHEKLPIGSEQYEEQLNMLHEIDHRPPELVTAAQKQLDPATTEVKDISNAIQLGQFVQESVLFPEEPLAYLDDGKTTSAKAADNPNTSTNFSLGQVKRADYDEELTEPSIHDFTGYPEDLTTSLDKSLDTAMSTRSEDTHVLSSEIVASNTVAPSSPNDQGHFGKSESAMPWTLEYSAFDETSIQPQVNKPSVHDMTPLDSLESIEPINHKVPIQPEEPEDKTKILTPRTEEINHFQINQTEEPRTSESLTAMENQHGIAELEPVTALEKSSLDSNYYVTMDSIEQVSELSMNQAIEEGIEEKPPTTEIFYVSEKPISFTDEESLEPLDNSTNVVEQNHPTGILEQNHPTGILEQSKCTETVKQTIPVEGGKPTTEVSFSDEPTSISHPEASSLQYTSSLATNTISVMLVEQDVEVSKTSNLIHPLQNANPLDHPQEAERETWVFVKMDELSDYKEESEEKPLRPASLNQDAEAQDEQKVEEDLVERASVCSTLSDPQLAAKSSSETSTPEELRTYEDSSSGVESHSDDAATSPQTTLTPDPDLGIHMGQEEGTETPAGTPASNNKGEPPSLQIVDIEGQSQSTSPSSIFDPSENNQIVRKKEMMASTESRKHDYEESAKERGAQRGNDD